MKKFLTLTLMASVACPSFAANNTVIKDANGAVATVCSKDIGSGVQALCRVDVDITGTPVGTGTNPLFVDTVVKATSTDRGAIIGFTGAAITTTSGSAAITVTTAPTAGGLIVGQTVTATGIPTGTTLASGSGTSWTLSANATASGSAVAFSSVGPQQIMASNTNRRGVAYQNQSAGDCYFNGTGGATADYHSLKVAAGAYYETPPSHTGTGAISVLCTAAAAALYAREW